jgi:hypothetical protein
MAKLTSAKRNSLASGSFVFPGSRKFPIEDLNHAKNAKARAAHIGGSVQKRVDAAVKAKFKI